MNEASSLEERIREKLAAVEAKRRDQKTALAVQMEGHQKRIEHFSSTARRWMETVIMPKMERLVACFENANLCPPDANRPFRCVCSFKHTEQFPATTTLELALFPDTALENRVVAYSVEILPILFQFEKKDQLTVPLDDAGNRKVVDWVEQKLLAFVDAYLQLPEAEHYQRDNLVLDAVCGMRINKQFAAASEQVGNETFYFCIEECRRKFLEDTSRYVKPAKR
jgi:YHS domain-containing protein